MELIGSLYVCILEKQRNVPIIFLFLSFYTSIINIVGSFLWNKDKNLSFLGHGIVIKITMNFLRDQTSNSATVNIGTVVKITVDVTCVF